jgi:hypothetical protein
MKLFKALLLLILVGGLFVSGYYLGSRQTGEFKSDLKKGREEMSEKAVGLEKEIRVLRLRLNHYSAGRHLASAEAAWAERNYGVGQDELKQAKKSVVDAMALSDPQKQKSLARFEDDLDRVIEASDRSDPDLAKRINALRQEFDQITG